MDASTHIEVDLALIVSQYLGRTAQEGGQARPSRSSSHIHHGPRAPQTQSPSTQESPLAEYQCAYPRPLFVTGRRARALRVALLRLNVCRDP